MLMYVTFWHNFLVGSTRSLQDLGTNNYTFLGDSCTLKILGHTVLILNKVFFEFKQYICVYYIGGQRSGVTSSSAPVMMAGKIKSASSLN